MRRQPASPSVTSYVKVTCVKQILPESRQFTECKGPAAVVTHDELLRYKCMATRIKSGVKQRNGADLYQELGCIIKAPTHDPDAVFS